MTNDENRALFLEAAAHQQAGRPAEAERAYRTLLARNPRVVPAHNNLGILLEADGRLDEAEACFRAALALRRNYPEALNNLGALLRRQHASDQAIACLREALLHDGENVEAMINLADILLELRTFDEIPALYARALGIRPGDPRIYKQLGRFLSETGDLAGAIDAFSRASALDPGDTDTRCDLLTCQQLACEWADFAASERRIIEAIRRGDAGANPFLALTLNTTPADQLDCARAFSARTGLKAGTPVYHPRAPAQRLRIGYLSSNFRAYPTAYLIANMLELHDRGRFEIIGYSAGYDDHSPTRARLERAVDKFVDVERLSDNDVAQAIVKDGIDILVCLMGHTKDARLAIASRRPAPIQVEYLNYPGTLGTDFIDYVIADEFVVPPGDRRYFSENVVYLPDCYQANDTKRPIAEATPPRAACGLPEAAFVFCCFNKTAKLTPDFFSIWMNILRRVEGSVLWLIENQTITTENLRREAAARGIDPARLVFAPRVALPEHLARHRLADLFLDCLPYNAHTTMSDALWAGLPAITCVGTSFPGRVGGSILRAAGLEELLTYDRAAYEELAVALARDPARLRAIRERLAADRLQLAVFDCARFTRHVENAYVRMMELHRAGRPPESFNV